MRRFTAILFIWMISLFSSSVCSDASDRWPMYQANPSHTGFIPVSLEPEKFELRWRQELTTTPLSPVTAAGGQVFVSQEGDSTNQTLYVLESKTGDIAWSKDFGQIRSINPPSYHDGIIYVQTGNQLSDTFLRAYRALTGELVFKSSHPAELQRYFAPTVFDGRVYINGGRYGGMYAFDEKTGQQEWFQTLAQYDQWTPAVDENRTYAYVGGNSPGLNVLDRSNGEIVFTISDSGFFNSGQSMYMAPVLGGLSDAFAINGGRLIRFNLETRELGWVNTAGFSGQPTVLNGSVYAISAGALGAYDQKTGALLWMWESPDNKYLENNIAATNSHLFVGTESSTFCIDLNDGTQAWSYPAGGHLTVGESTLYIAGSDGTLIAIALGVPDLYVTESVVFDRANPGDTVTNSIQISNVGDAPLEVRSIESSSNAFVVQVPALPLVLEAHQSVSVEVSFTLEEGGTRKGTLAVTGTDPNEPVIYVSLTGRSNEIHTVSSKAGSGGQISPSGEIYVQDGDSAFFKITPANSHCISEILVDGASIGNPSCFRLRDITADRSIEVKFTPKPNYTINATATSGGSISPSGQKSIMEGTAASYNIYPHAGYELTDVIVDGVSIGKVTSYSFTKVSSNHTIHAEFSPLPKYYITATANEGGHISPSGLIMVYGGNDQRYNLVEYSSHMIADVFVDGISIGPTSSYTFSNVTSDHTIRVIFTARPKFTIAASAGAGGRISPSGQPTVYRGNDLGFYFTPDKGYMVSDVVVDGVSLGPKSSYSFSDVNSNHTIHVNFTTSPRYSIDASAGTGGKISPSGRVMVYHGDNQYFTITPDIGYKISDVLRDGVSVGTGVSPNFYNVTANHSISAVFSPKPQYVITASAGAGGQITPSGQRTVYREDSINFTITPDKGFQISEVLVDGVSVGKYWSWYFSNVADNHSITAKFTAKPEFLISATAGPGGRITPSGEVITYQDDNELFSIVPDKGFKIVEVFVDGVSMGSPSSYQFSKINSAHTISASFAPNADYFGVQNGNRQKFRASLYSGYSDQGTMQIREWAGTTPPGFTVLQYLQGMSTLYVQKTTDGLGITQMQSAQGKIEFSSPLLTLKNPIRPGLSWTSRATALANGASGKAVLTARVSAKTHIKITAGHFLAFPISYSLTFVNGAKRSSSAWTEYFVPYVGTVKTVDSDSVVEVISFGVNGGAIGTPPPIITGVTPSSASPGTRITITGYHFGAKQGKGTVNIGGIDVRRIASWSNQKITCVVPQGVSSGKIVVSQGVWTSNQFPRLKIIP
ncbi:MAG: PQQ-binding-like beta-propeller repeat protein [Syntrophobacteraceae bacterium]